MALSFPASPSVNDTFTSGARTWTWSGTIWEITGSIAAAGSVGPAELAANAVTSAKLATSISLTGTPLAPTAAAATNTTQIATTQFVRTEVSNLVGTAGATLDTLGELATALGNDAALSTTLTTSIGLKAPLASPTLTGVPLAPTAAAGTNTTQIATMDSRPWNIAWGQVALSVITSNITSNSSSEVTRTSVTWTAVANRYYKITWVEGKVDNGVNASVNNHYLRTTTTSGTIIAHTLIYYPSSSLQQGSVCSCVKTFSAGTQTVFARVVSNASTDTTWKASATEPAYLLVEDIGPA